MAKKKLKQGESIDGLWYTAGEAAKVLTANSGREVKPDYLAKLGSMEKVRTKRISPRLTFYSKEDIDAYRVEARGEKSGRAKRLSAKPKETDAA